MDVMSILVWLVVGLIAGWLAGEVTRGTGFGLVGNIILGIVGAVLGGLLLSALGFGVGGGILVQILVAFLGAVVVLMLWLMISCAVVILGAEINAEAEHQTAKDTTTGRRRPLGERGAVVADNVADVALTDADRR